MSKDLTRRSFLAAACVGAAAGGSREMHTPAETESPAYGTDGARAGEKPVRTEPFPSWPIISDNEEKTWMEVLRGKRWNRLDGTYVARFENAWAKQLGARYCVATANGTSALFTCLNALGIGPGDEVLVPPYTFVATINVVLLQHALPIFVDTDRETMQMDARKVEAAITQNTRCIIPVHLGGSAANLDTILAVAKKRQIPVIEDACQAHLGEWRRRKVGTLGDAGCFSFQASKNLNCGEGGAIVTDNAEFHEICNSFHNQGRANKDAGFAYARNGDNKRLTEFQGALLLEQLTRLEQQARIREQNATYLTKMLGEIPGIMPARMYEGCTRNAYHLYMFRYDQNHFAGLSKSGFMRALRAEGIPCSGGYDPLDKEPFLTRTLHSRAYQRIYSATEIAGVEERNRCPENEALCREAVWFTQNMLLGSKVDMEQIAEAVKKVQRRAPVTSGG